MQQKLIAIVGSVDESRGNYDPPDRVYAGASENLRVLPADHIEVQMEKQDRARASAPIAQVRVPSSSKKKRRNVQRRTRGSASLPAPAERLGPIISTVHTNDSTLTRNKGP